MDEVVRIRDDDEESEDLYHLCKTSFEYEKSACCSSGVCMFFKRLTKQLCARSSTMMSPLLCTTSLKEAVSGSNIPWLTYVVIALCAFLMLLITEREVKHQIFQSLDVIKCFLIATMTVSVLGQFYAIAKKSNHSFVRYDILQKYHSNAYLLAGAYVFGSGAIFVISLRLQIYNHADAIINCFKFKVNSSSSNEVIMAVLPNNTTTSPIKTPNIDIICGIDVINDIVRWLFTVTQLAFLQAFHSASFANSSKVKFVVFHTILAHICVWVNYVSEETGIFKSRKKGIFKSRDAAIKTALEFSETATPFILEFSLIAAGMLYAISCQMQLLQNHNGAQEQNCLIQHQCLQQSPLQPGSSRTSLGSTASFDAEGGLERINRDSYSNRAQPTIDNDSEMSSHSTGSVTRVIGPIQPGLILGLILGLGLFGASLTFDGSSNRNSTRSRQIFLLFETVTSFLQFTSISSAFKELRSHSKYLHEVKPDDFMLIIGLVGSFAFDFMTLLSAVESCTLPIKNFSSQSAIITIIGAFILIVAKIFQTIFIIFSRRYLPNGRSVKTLRSAYRIQQWCLFLLTTNLGLWAMDSFVELRNGGVNSYPYGKVVYGKTWSAIEAITYPVNIFFRFHSAAMLFELWARFKLN